MSYNNAGVFYYEQGRLEKSEKYILAAIEIYECLAKKNAAAYEPYLAGSYNNAGEFYANQDYLEKSEKYYFAAIEIYERLVKENAAAYEPDLADSYFNYYLLKKDKTYLDKAYEIAKRRQDDPRCGKLMKDIESMLK